MQIVVIMSGAFTFYQDLLKAIQDLRFQGYVEKEEDEVEIEVFFKKVRASCNMTSKEVQDVEIDFSNEKHTG